MSFAAYCFHIPVGDYLQEIKDSMQSNTVLIFDIRRTKRDWLETLIREFGKPKVLFTAEKLVRCAFNVKN